MACLLFLLACNNQEKSMINSNVIDVESGVENNVRLKTSDFGKTIRYIPLETTDNGLVGRSPIIKVLRDYIVIEAQNSCLLFDKKDGRFIAEIGRMGQGPNEFSSNYSWTDEKEEFLYFQRQPNQLLKYDMKGNFSGNIRFSTSPDMNGNFIGNIRFSTPLGLASHYLFTDTEIIGYFAGINQQAQFALGFFDKEGSLKDSVPLLYPKREAIADEIVSITIHKGYNLYGSWSKAGVIVIDYKNDQRQLTVSNAARIWKNKDDIRFKEEFIDTIFTVSNNTLIPSIIFHTGKYHWPLQESTLKKNTNDRIFIAEVTENNAFIFFQCIKGMYADEPVLYHGLYEKETGQTKLGKDSDTIEDDLTHFMPFTPMGLSTSGEFISLVEAWSVMEWLDKHPDAINNDKLSFLRGLDAEMNPVVVLIE